MVTLYTLKSTRILKDIFIHNLVSFFILKMNYLTSQLLIEEEIEALIKNLKKKIFLGKMGKKLQAVMPQ